MTRKEAAEFIGRSVRQVDRLCDEHKIKRIYVGGSVRILKSSLLEYKGLVLQQDCKSEMSETKGSIKSISDPMNYLTEIKLFYDWLETHDLTPSGIALWHALMFIANRCRWKEKFAASNSILESRTQMPRTTIYRARKRLQSFGLIDVFPQGSNNSSLYTLNSLKGVLAFQNNGQNETQNETHNGTQPAKMAIMRFRVRFRAKHLS